MSRSLRRILLASIGYSAAGIAFLMAYFGLIDWFQGNELFQILNGALDFYMFAFFGIVAIFATNVLTSLEPNP